MEPEHADALKALKERDGIPESEQIRRALKDWFNKHRIKVQPSRTARKGR
jgi:hypothetical protein